MILDRDLQRYVIYEQDTIANALNRIIDNRSQIICAIDAHNVIQGLFTNGDFLRWVTHQPQIDLTLPVSVMMNRQFIYAQLDDEPAMIEEKLKQVLYVPIVDERHHLIAVARQRDERIQIGQFTLSPASPTFIIAEIGINHNGQLSIAKQLIDAAVEAEASCAKFQIRNLKKLYQNAGDANDIRENLGSQYTLDLLSRFQLTEGEIIEAFDYCKARGILPLCTPWDLDSLQLLEDYGMQAYKVASADMTNHELLRAMAKTGKPLICSTGMSDEDEIRQTVDLLQELGVQYVLLQCNSTYPAPYKDIHLRYMNRLAEIGECVVGYSGHERGYHIPIAAVAMGGRVIEKHITLDRNMEGNDHKVSLLPDEFKAMVKQIRELEQALGSASPRQITQGEMMNRANLAKSLVINRDLAMGETITAEMIDVKSPGRGLQPNALTKLIGRKAQHSFRTGDFFYPSDLEDQLITARPYRFNRPWGVPVRYYDYKTLMGMSNPDFVEFHLSYKDMEVDFRQFVDHHPTLGFAVHSPDLFPSDHLLDLAATDESYRQRSIYELQRVVNLTRELSAHFRPTARPIIIASLGGFTKDGFIQSPVERQAMYARIADSLRQIDQTDVEIVGQTLPPFPWYFGGQMFLNLFTLPDEMIAFCQEHDYRICFDTSHSKLTCSHYKLSFKEFAEAVTPYAAHLHVVDALGVDGEGVQIGEGDIDFKMLCEALNRLAPNASFIPEIWQGHENNGAGFWKALERLEGLL